METNQHLLSEPLPLVEDYKSLKEEGLSFIQKVSAESWTNLNSTDPGITILEQVCFALTELGYCSQFSIEDVLTHRDGSIDFKNQFYHPDKILTVSPITLDDYVRYLFDQFSSIKKLSVATVNNGFPQIGNVIKTWVPPSSKYDKGVLTSIWFALNSARNIEQLFQSPEFLKEKTFRLKGHIEIDENASVHEMVERIDQAVNAYIFPDILATGFQKLEETGENIDEIFNGPFLQNGWIAKDGVTEKRDVLSSDEVTRLLKSVQGVESVSGIEFVGTDSKTPTNSISCHENELLYIDVFKSDFNINGVALSTKAPDIQQLKGLLARTTEEELQGEIESANSEPDYPKGQFRDINEYYSIQNTFPEAFGVGETSEHFNGTKKANAQRKQLIAYLTLFDQVIANQFSQLANVSNLFSFKNSTTGTPSDEATFYKLRDQTQKKQLKYPVPYKSFSPTYFYQSLYESVTSIRPVLRNNEAFDFDIELESEKELEDESWKEYQDSPYNTYIHGLMDIVEDPHDNLTRRNTILNHLLARNGESPEVLDLIIKETRISGNSMQDRVLLKSAMLRNLAALSYNRYKGYNFLAATEIQLDPKIHEENTYSGIIKRRHSDFIFNSEEFEKETTFGAQDFIDYSCVEIQLNLLFGLTYSYHNYILETNEDETKEEELAQVIWFLQERKGLIMIEKSLLSRYAHFELIYQSKLEETALYKSRSIPYFEMLELSDLLASLDKQPDGQKIVIQGAEKTYELEEMDSLEDENPVEEKWFKTINAQGDKLAIKTSYGNQLAYFEDPNQSNGIICVFPSYVTDFRGQNFLDRLKTFFEYVLPIHVSPEIYTLTHDKLATLIPNFTGWHNDLLYREEAEQESSAEATLKPTLEESGRKLVANLMEIELLGYD